MELKCSEKIKKINAASRSETLTHRKIRLIILLLIFAGSIFFIFDYRENILSSSYPYATLQGGMGLALLLIAAGFGIFAVFGIFKDLSSRQNADIQMSLPMSAKERYLSKILALCKLHIFPMLIASAALLLICLAKEGFTAEHFKYLTAYLATTVCAALFSDAAAIFCMCCCGAKAEGIYTTLITIFCVTLMPFLYFTKAVSNFSGVYDFPNADNIFALTGLMSVPIAFEMEWEAMPYVLANCLISCLIVFLSFLIYKKRDASTVGSPMVYRLFFELFMFMGLSTLFTMFCFSNMWWVGMTIAVIVYLIIRIVAARAKLTVLRFGGWLLKFALSTGVFIGITAIGYYTNGFGFANLTPDTDSAEYYCADLSLMYSREYDESTDYGYEYEIHGKKYKTERLYCNDEKFFTEEADRQRIGGMIDAICRYNADRDHSFSGFKDKMFGSNLSVINYYYYSERYGNSESDLSVRVNFNLETVDGRYKDELKRIEDEIKSTQDDTFTMGYIDEIRDKYNVTFYITEEDADKLKAELEDMGYSFYGDDDYIR